MTESLRRQVPFSGRRSVTAPATCAQRDMWRLIQRAMPDSTFYDQVYPVELLKPGGVDDVIAVLAELVNRYESLRTAFHRDETGALMQRVLRTGSFETDIRRAGSGEDPKTVAATWQQSLRHRSFNLQTGPLFRSLVILSDDVPVLASLGISHLVADLMSLRFLASELTRLLSARVSGQPAPAPPACRQPVEQAAYERSPRGQQALARSHAYWRRQLAQAPTTMFPYRRDEPSAPRFYSAAMESKAVAMAIPVLADRYRTSTSAVLLSAVALLLGHLAGLPACAIRLLVANRFAPELRGAVANLQQEILVTLDLTGETFGEVVRAALAASMTAYSNGVYDPDQVGELIRSAGRERGAELSLSCYFNDIRRAREVPGRATAVDAGFVRAAMADTVVAADSFRDAEDFFIVIEDKVPGWIRMVLCTDTQVLLPEEIHQFLLGVERLLVALVDRELRPEEVGAVCGVTSMVHR
ncbi:condensation domain-containing protein [Micromonospora sp. B11E3]|uniref:condensation domain-containing protein n=1 Tax=Micromonospora sp. B11E3 TaxID=3153562 RepID=UPI00325E233F